MFAQTAPKGAYVLSETSNVSATLTTLSFADDGSVVGTALVQQGGPIVAYAVQGVLTVSADGGKTLTLSGSSLEAVDAAGEPLPLSRTLKLIPISADAYATLSTDPGQYVRGELNPASASVAPGEYVVNGKSVDPAATSVEIVTLDGSGSLSGREVVNSFGAILERALSGAYASTSNGFIKIDVTATYTDENGDAQSVTESYLAAATRKDIRMLQVEASAVGLLTMSK
jgi:hypothetical protein